MTKEDFFNIISTVPYQSEYHPSYKWLEEFFQQDMYNGFLNVIVKVPVVFGEKSKNNITKKQFWKTWSGKCACLSAGDDEEYWGFNKEEDAMMFKLTWG